MSRLESTIKRFEARIEAGQYYEAHQTLRTITNRYVKAKQYAEAAQILTKGASVLAANKQYASAADLISYLIEVYSDQGVCDSESKVAVIELVRQLPDGEKAVVDLSKQAIQWSQKYEKSKFGDAALHDTFGAAFARSLGQGKLEDDAKLFAVTELHLILGSHASLAVYVDLLAAWSARNPQVDPGMFLARAVINYGYLHNVKFATEAADRFMKKLSERDSSLTPVEKNGAKVLEGTPLINFAQLLALTLPKQADAGTKFLGLYNHYKPELEKAELLAPTEYLGKEYFGLNLGKPKQGNMMANLLGDFFK
ncbi:golgi to ER traffic protein 4 [Diutina catenulata]